MHGSVPHLLRLFVLLLLLVAGAGGLLRFSRLPLAQRYLVGAVGWALLMEVTADAFAFRHQPNLFLIPFDVVGELTLLALAYRPVLRSAALHRWLPVGLAVFAAYALGSSVARPAALRFRPDLQVTEDCLLLLLVALYFRQLLSEMLVKQLEREPMFWVSTGLFIYCLGNIQIALFSNYLLQHYSRQLNSAVWNIHLLLILVLYGCYAIALWMRLPK